MRNILKPGTGNSLLLAANALFLLLFLMLSYYNRFAADDYYHIHDEQTFGIWGGMLEGYFNWGGRWTSYLLWDIVYHFHHTGAVLFLYTFSIILLFIAAIFLLLREIFELSGIPAHSVQILNHSILFSAFAFLISSGKGEAWFWMQSTAMFMLSIISFLFGLSIILSKKKNIIHYFFLIICFVYAGGAGETYAVFYFIFLLLLTGVLFVFPSTSLINKIRGRALSKTITGLAFLTISFVISVTAPGNAIRATWLPEPSFTDSLYTTLKSLYKLIVFKISFQIPWILLFTIPWVFLGFAKGEKQTKTDFGKYIRTFFLSGVVLIFLFYVMLFPSCYILSEIGPDRSLSQIFLLLAIFCAGWAFFAGYKCTLNKKIISVAFYFSLIIIIVSLIILNFQQYRFVSKYAAALDKRSEYLSGLQQKKNTKTIVLKPLPLSGFLYSAEISDDTAYFGNEHYKRGLSLNFKVMLEKKSKK